MQKEVLNTKELIAKVAKSYNCYQQDAEELITEHLFQIFAEELSKKRGVRLHPFGSFFLENNNTIIYKPSTTILREISNRKS